MLAPEPHQPLHLTQQRRRGAILMDLADPSIDTELQDEAPPPDEGQAEEARQVAESLVIALGQELHQKFIKAKSDRKSGLLPEDGSDPDADEGDDAAQEPTSSDAPDSPNSPTSST